MWERSSDTYFRVHGNAVPTLLTAFQWEHSRLALTLSFIMHNKEPKCCLQMHFLSCKCSEMRFRPGLCPWLCSGSSQHSPDSLAGLRGPTSKGGEGREREGHTCKWRERGPGMGSSRTGLDLEDKILWSWLWSWPRRCAAVALASSRSGRKTLSVTVACSVYAVLSAVSSLPPHRTYGASVIM